MGESTGNNGTSKKGIVTSDRSGGERRRSSKFEWPEDGSRPTVVTYNTLLHRPVFNGRTAAMRDAQRLEWESLSGAARSEIMRTRGESLTRKQETALLNELERAEREAAGRVTAAAKADAPPAHRPAMAPVGAEARNDQTALGNVRTELTPAVVI